MSAPSVSSRMQRLEGLVLELTTVCTDPIPQGGLTHSDALEMENARASLLSALRELAEDAERLDWLEREAGRRVRVREESDADICNVYFHDPADPLRGGVFAGLRDVADFGLKFDTARSPSTSKEDDTNG
jgi:hypothetical protein